MIRGETSEPGPIYPIYLSDAAAYINGVTLDVNGGRAMM